VVDCRRSIPAIADAIMSKFPPAVAAVLPVGLVLSRPVVCVDGTLPWEAVARTPVLLSSLGGVPVLDREGRLELFLPRTTLALAGRSHLAGGPVSVADLAVTALSVHESASLRDAFAVMGRHRVRELTVVGDEGIVVGRLLDLDALHFVAHVARTGMRPALERAA
jgi:CBS domain-containing protein